MMSGQLHFNDRRVLEAGAWGITAMTGAIIGRVIGAAAESTVHPEATEERNDLSAAINQQQAAIAGVETEITRHEHGYKPRTDHSLDELRTSQTELQTSVSEFRTEKEPLDQDHNEFLALGVIIGVASSLAIRGIAKTYRHFVPKQSRSSTA